MTINDLVHLLAQPNKHLPLLQNETAKCALIQISALLNNNTSAIQSLSSEGKGSYTSNNPAHFLHNPTPFSTYLEQPMEYTIPTPKSKQNPLPRKQLPYARLVKPRLTSYSHSIPTKTLFIPIMQAQSIVPMINHIYNNEGKRQSIEKLLQNGNTYIWSHSLSNEMSRISQGTLNI